MEKLYTFDRSYEAFEKAQKFIPGGIFGSKTPYFVTYGSYPVYVTKGKGSHVWDVDGNEYIDFMCSYGANIIGMCNDEVDAAVAEQLKKGNTFTPPSEIVNVLAERMVKLVDGMDWIVFGKNGADITTFATTVARLQTGRTVILKAEGAYHGAHFWSVHSTTGIPAEYKAHVAEFRYNDAEDLRRVAAENSGKIAAIILCPYKHDHLHDQEFPTEEFKRAVEEVRLQEKAFYIQDDIRCGFRLHPNGSHCYFGVKPDLTCMGKAMSNGYAISALLGKRELMDAARAAYFSGTFFYEAIPMAASLATLDILERDRVVDYVLEIGTMLENGLCEQAKEFGIEISYTGHPSMPFFRFKGDADFSTARYFCGEAAKRGVYFHPHHNMFVCAAHTKEDIEKTLEVTGRCFALVAQSRG
ncbi:MAG: aspartate aminotransferase family protein [Chloroflexota bacterium]